MIKLNDLENKYYDWVTEQVKFSQLENEIIRIDTPFYDRHNDSIIMYIVESTEGLKITDGGYTIDDLESDGIYINKSPKRRSFLDTQLTSYGVSWDESNNFLSLKTNFNDFPKDKHRLLQAMLFTNDLFLTSNDRAKGVFFEDVQNFMEEYDIRAMENVSLQNPNGLSHKFEFSIAGSKKRAISDKLIKILSSPNNEMYAKALATDVNYARKIVNNETDFYTIINDTNKEIDGSIRAMMDDANIKTIPFSERKNFVEELTA